MNSQNAHWTAAEDTVLVAAIRKYGLFQWSRISSLLPRKTPSQCKARWFNYINPNLVKSQWSTTEDSRLIQLVRDRPNQWATISQFLNRSVDDCVKRYRQLMTDNVTGESHVDTSAPESRPSTTKDAVEEFENEMISEAQSRLAINQGKKPQRKARERAQAQAKQLADIQRRRELEQLGHKMRQKAKAKIQGIDYNAEIPFEHRPPKGPYDVTVENQIAEKDQRNWERNIKGVTLAAADLFTGSKYEIGGKKRKRDAKKDTKDKRPKIAEQLEPDNELNEKEVNRELKNRKKLVFTDDLNLGNQIDFKGTLTNLNSRTQQKSVLLNKNQNSLDFVKSHSDEKEEKKRKKNLRRKLKDIFSKLNDVTDSYDNAIIEEIEVPPPLIKEESDEKSRLTREQIKDILTPQAYKLGLPIPNPFSQFNSDNSKNEIEKEFQRLVSMPYLEHIDDFDMVAYQKILSDIDSEMKLGKGVKSSDYLKEIEAVQKEFIADKAQMIQIIMKCTQKSTTIDNAISNHLQPLRQNAPIMGVEELKEVQDKIWVQKQIGKVERSNFKVREQNLKRNIKVISEKIK